MEKLEILCYVIECELPGTSMQTKRDKMWELLFQLKLRLSNNRSCNKPTNLNELKLYPDLQLGYLDIYRKCKWHYETADKPAQSFQRKVTLLYPVCICKEYYSYQR